MTDKEKYEELSYKPKNVYENLTDEQAAAMQELCAEYREFLDKGKTERECCRLAEKTALENGFKPLDGTPLKAGDRVYSVNRGKGIFMAVIGSEDIENGINIVGAHIDSPRLDLKQNPLYESDGMAFLDTHYYGGIKKYQWTTIPMALHGVMFTKDGRKIDICVGEDDGDPVFCVTDLLIHLATKQMQKKLADGVTGEDLNLLVGGMGIKSDEVKEKVKYNVLCILNEKYGITEEDFLSAEIEIVPAFKAREVGFDRSFIGAYGQDDRVCAFTTLKAVVDIKGTPKKTAVAILVDKEEIGSCGNTGMLSDNFRMTIAELAEAVKGECSMMTLNRIIKNSDCMSSDVGAAFDPNYGEVFEKRNTAFAGNGMIIMKYTGARGKSGSNDANAEYVYKIRRIMDDANVIWQTGELGRVDEGGGGTIAQYAANLNMNVIDCGVPVLSMHAPFEITAKSDVYMAYRAYAAFYESV